VKAITIFALVLLTTPTDAQELKIAEIERMYMGQLVAVPNFLTEKGFVLDSADVQKNNYSCYYSHPLSGNQIEVKYNQDSEGAIDAILSYYVVDKEIYQKLIAALQWSRFYYDAQLNVYLKTTSSYSHLSFYVRENEEYKGKTYYLIQYVDYQGKELSMPPIESEQKD
jgi:hypothetical protein